MGFAAPLALLALLAAGIPIAAHLMRQKDLPVRELPTIALLARARAESRRRFRIRDRWLLALRVLAVVALAVAAAAPFVWRESAFADGRLSSLVVIVDDSMSMLRERGGEPAIRQALERAEQTVAGLGDGSEVALVWAGEPARLAVPRSDSRAAVLQALRTARFGARGTDLEGAAQLARRALGSARHHRRVLVLSDFAAATDAEAIDWPDAELAFTRIGESTRNVAVVDAVAAANPATRRTSLRVRLRADEPVSVVVEDERGQVLATTEAQPDEEGHANLTLEVEPADSPSLTVRAEADDALPMDDRRVVLLEPPAASEVLLVDGDAAGAVGRGEVAYLSRALEVLPAAERERGSVRVRTVDADALDAGALDGVDVVFLANVGAPSATAARALLDHHAAGGAIVVSVGDRVRPRAWRARIGDLLPATLGTAQGGRKSLQPSSERTRALSQVSADRVLAIDPHPGATVEARWSDGTPALVVRDRVALWSSTIDEAWTDLPFHPGFVALVHQLARNLTDHPRAPAAALAGQTIPVAPGTRVEDPSGERWAADEQGFDRTLQPGLYQALDSDDAVVGRFVITPPAEESDLVEGPIPHEDAGAETLRATRRSPFGSWVFLLFGLAVLAEGFLRGSRRLSR